MMVLAGNSIRVPATGLMVRVEVAAVKLLNHHKMNHHNYFAATMTMHAASLDSMKKAAVLVVKVAGSVAKLNATIGVRSA